MTFLSAKKTDRYYKAGIIFTITITALTIWAATKVKL